MTEVAPKLFVGTTGEIQTVIGKKEFQIVNLAHTYHYQLHKWDFRGTDYSGDKCYLIHEDPRLLSVNWVDAKESRYFDYKGQGVRTFEKIFNFIHKFRGPFKVLIACNRGESRAPSVAMAYLAKCTDVLSEPMIDVQKGAAEGKTIEEMIDKDTFYEKPKYGQAREKFLRLFPQYYPGAGITEFLIDHWDQL